MVEEFRLTTKKATLKVHQLAKELGVNSKDIVARCKSEEIEGIENHLSPVSVGLAVTIREWFGSAGGAGGESEADGTEAAEASKASRSAGASGSGLGTVEKPKAVRKAVRKRETGDAAAEGETPPAKPQPAVARAPAAPPAAVPASPAPVAEPAPERVAPPPPTPTEERVKVSAVPAPPLPRSTIATRPVTPSAVPPAATPPSRPGIAASAPAGQRAPRTAEPAPAAASPGVAPEVEPDADLPRFDPSKPPVMNVPKRPDVIRAAGPRLEAPVKTALSGPKVIRIEAPENLPAPRPRSASGTGTGAPARVGRAGGRDDRGRDGASSGRSGRLARATREGTPTAEPWRAQDLREREDRLSKSGGFFRTHRSDLRRPGSGGGPGGSRTSVRDAGEPVRISEPITIKELSAATGVKAADILKKLFLGGTIATINSAIDREKAIEVMMDFDIELVVEEQRSAAELIESRFEDREAVDVRPRAPVVAILGHVDHGKTSLLDRIRNTNVASGEAGGITQKTSAFQVPVKAGDKDRVVTFIDTPGHEAFTNMRARGAKVTDIVVLVVAADDGVMPQTAESIVHAKAAGVPIVVALNKIDKPEATESNIRRILGQLAEKELNPVEWGGTTEVMRTSATRGDGIQDLLDVLDYQAELLGLTADFGGEARGTVLEAKMEEGRGPVASVIVQEGLIKKGDFIVVGRGYGRVRDIVNDRGQRLPEAGPSTPVAISGMDVLPDAGDKFFVVESLKAAEEAAEERRRIDRERELATPKVTLDTFFASLEKGKRKELSLVVKADTQGSVEALRAELSKIGTDEISVGVKHCAVGGITESDVALAEATKAIIVGFNVTSSAKARAQAEAKGIEIRLYDVIYDLKDDVTKAASGLLSPEIKLEVLGHAEVRQVFRISKVGMIAGCYVLDGTIERNAQIRVTRDGIVVEKDRRLEQLKRFKDDAKEVRAGQECGMKIVGYDDIKTGDVLECYKTVQVARSL